MKVDTGAVWCVKVKQSDSDSLISSVQQGNALTALTAATAAAAAAAAAAAGDVFQAVLRVCVMLWHITA